MDDQYFLQRAVEVGSRQASPSNYGAFGAVIVRNGEIIAEDCNHVHELADPTAHAEISAIRAACQKLGTYNLEGCTLYGSYEPCLMCFSCAAWARMDRVVFAQRASDAIGSTYEFEGISIEEMAKHLVCRPIKVDYLPLVIRSK